MKTIITLGILIGLIFIGSHYFIDHQKAEVGGPDPLPTHMGKMAFYMCDNNKTITANFAIPIDPLLSSSTVELILDNTEKVMLTQGLSGSGVRYLNADGSIEFWEKGNSALVLQNNEEKDYRNCLRVAESPANAQGNYALPNIYKGETFTLRLPQEELYTATTSYTYDINEVNSIKGTKFTIPLAYATGTNLSSDTYLSVESIPNTESCTADIFFDGIHDASVITVNDTQYSIASSSNAGAGNRYEETVYALAGTNPCIGVRYVVHYTNLQNYDEGTIREFDRVALLKEFDQIRSTLVINQ